MDKQDFLKNIKEIDSFEFIYENNDIFSDGKFLNSKYNNLNL
jgi:hypothetical protein